MLGNGHGRSQADLTTTQNVSEITARCHNQQGSHELRNQAQPSEPTTTMSNQFISNITAATDIFDNWPEDAEMPDTTMKALVAAVNIACDTLFDAEIKHDELPDADGMSTTHQAVIRFPDGSRATAIIDWMRDVIELFDHDLTDQEWQRGETTGKPVHLMNQTGVALLLNINNSFFEELKTDPEIEHADPQLVDAVDTATHVAADAATTDESGHTTNNAVCG